jgi:hypothetical protein
MTNCGAVTTFWEEDVEAECALEEGHEGEHEDPDLGSWSDEVIISERRK